MMELDRVPVSGGKGGDRLVEELRGLPPRELVGGTRRRPGPVQPLGDLDLPSRNGAPPVCDANDSGREPGRDAAARETIPVPKQRMIGGLHDVLGVVGAADPPGHRKQTRSSPTDEGLHCRGLAAREETQQQVVQSVSVVSHTYLVRDSRSRSQRIPWSAGRGEARVCETSRIFIRYRPSAETACGRSGSSGATSRLQGADHQSSRHAKMDPCAAA
jgi:hypothetical protein